MATSNRTLRVTKDEWTFFGTLLPYFLMVLGALLTFLLGVLTRVGIMLQQQVSETPIAESSWMMSVIVLVSCAVLSLVAYRLFKRRNEDFITLHAIATIVLAHAWVIFAVWEDSGDWMFGGPALYVWFYGSIIVGLSWCIRRWTAHTEEVEQGNVFAAIGLGEGTHIDKERSYATSNGAVYRLKGALGTTVEDMKKKAVELAQIAGKSRRLVHVSETEDGVEGQVDITILKEDPFKAPIPWEGPEWPGDSIGTPISFATYDTGERGRLFLAGKDGGSSQHYLTMGMPGTGKSKVWQAIYGTVLSRKNVSVIYGDPAKGMQTGGALASGLDWFEWTIEGCEAQIKAVMEAIPRRTNYLTSKGYSHWKPGCGLNFLIFHLEEAARFANVSDLVGLLEAARSAGISIVISLQRASHDRINTSTRYNLGGNLCFGVKNKSDATFGLSEYARESGAAPHFWQDRFPGYFYLEAAGIDQRLAAHPLFADWVDEQFLERVVDEGAAYRTPMDTTTAEALGAAYALYRRKVEEGTTDWQVMRNNRNHQTKTLELGNTIEQQELPFDVDVTQASDTRTVATVRNNLGTDPEETARANAEFMSVLIDWHANGKHVFSNKEVGQIFTLRKGPWISKKLQSLQKDGKLEKTDEGFWRIISL